MSVIKKYNPDTKEWDVIATSNASSISVRSESLLEDGQEETNVESVLQKFNQDINTLKGNVSWLAEHGGGGSGGGSGTTTDATIMVNGQETGSTLVLDSTGLNIVVQAKSSSLKWNLTISTDSQTIKSVENFNKITVTPDELDKLGITSSFNLNVVAFNEGTLTNVYWNGRIQRATVELDTTSEVSFKFEERHNNQIIYTYIVGVLDTYALYINDIQVDEPKSVTAFSGEWSINLSDIEKYLKKELNVGSNTIVARMKSVSNPSIVSPDCTSRIILTAEEPIISCSSLGTDASNRSPIYGTAGKSTVLSVPYTVYYTSGSYKAQICSSESEKVAWSNITEYNNYNTYYENASYTIESVEIGVDVNITIYILDTRTSKEYKATFYCVTKTPDYNLLEIGVEPVFTFQSFNGNIKNNKWSETNATLTIKNSNAKSSAIQTSDNKSLRLQNAAYGIISNNVDASYYNTWFTDTIKQFTLSICYRADFHPDDDRTILQFGTLNTRNIPASGIVIRDHKIYIQSNTYALEDSELLDIAITYKQASVTSKTGKVFIYVNGVVECVFENIEPTGLIPESEKDIYLASMVDNGESSQSTDVSIYRVSLYNTCLNPVQVLYEYLNDQAYTHLSNGLPDADYIEAGLKRNFITVDNHTSLLYNTNVTFDNNSDNYNDNFTFSNLIVIREDNAYIKDDIANYIVPIPIMLIDVSPTSSWTWDNFITPNSPLTAAGNCNFQYYDQNNTNPSIIVGTCDVDLQGTSTLSDAIKNLQISFPDDTVFIPKETWFPESTYGLKADIVDSSHSLNTSIGKFVNTEFGLDNTNSSWYPYSSTVKESFVAQKQNSSSAINKYFPKATLKHGVEGFPVFLILRFKGSDNDNGLHSMGIYQFILGRKSPRNLGYEIINKVTGLEETNITYPFYKTGVNISVKENKGYWIEMGRNEAFSNDDKFQESDSLEDAKMTGLFWQEDKNGVYYNDIAEIKYTNMGNDAVSYVSQFAPFTNFVHNIVSLPVTNRRYSSSGGSNLIRHTFANTSYPIYNSKQTESGIVWEKGEGSNLILSSSDELEAVLKQLEIDSYAQYFVICMFFGLIDNFMKNMPIKFFQKSDGSWENPLLGIYDTDSGCGNDNEAENKVAESVWISTIANKNGTLSEVSGGSAESTTKIIGQNNKLWYFDSRAVDYSKYNITDGTNVSIFAAKWNSFINHLKAKYANTEYAINSLEDIVTLYYDKYFIPQTEGCGELLFNLTYFTKYLNKYQKDGATINQASKLHGRRQQQIKHWLKNRIKFLDSMFTAMGYSTSMGTDVTPPFTPLNVSINSGSVPEFHLTTNYPIVTKITNQTGTGTYVFLDENTDTSVYWGSTEQTSQTVNHTLTYSNAIQTLGNDEQTLKDIYFAKVNSGAIPYLTVYNASSCSYLATQADAISYFKYNNKSELREINLSNTAKSSNLANWTYDLDLSTGFEKLQKLNLYNSCVTKIILPTGDANIPLLELDLRNSQIGNLDLEQQNLLSNLDLSGCSNLGTLKISNCALLTQLSLDKTQASLNTVSIQSAAFKIFNCVDNDSVTEISIASSNLESVKITNCKALKTLTLSGDSLTYLNLQGCSSLTTLNITNPQSSINTLNLKSTKLAAIQYNNQIGTENIITNEDGTISYVLDLSKFTSIGDFNIQENDVVQYIQFNNDQSIPIYINNKFSNTNLERVYGNIAITVNSVFYGCSKFSIHGADQVYNGVSMLDTDGRTKHFTEVSSVVSNNKPKFQTGTRVTNLDFKSSSGTNNFRGTSCTLLDAYYVFYNIGQLQNCENMFQNANLDLSWDEDHDNSLHKKTFVNCGSVTSLAWCFRDETSAKIRVFSPSHNSEGSITADDGLFSPLTNCESIDGIFYGQTVYADRFTFRRTSGLYAIYSMQYWTVRLIVDDVNSLTGIPDNEYLIKNYSTLGNLDNYFVNLKDVAALYGFLRNTLYINYDTMNSTKTGNKFLCPANTYWASFVSTYASGTIDFENLFRTPSLVTEIKNSFVGTGDSNSNTLHNLGLSRATFTITSSMLDKFTSLKNWGYQTSGDFAGSLNVVPFSGSEIERTIKDDTFPYTIFASCSNLTSAEGFFKDLQEKSFEGDVSLPGTLFVNNPKLESVKGLFYNCNFNFTLTSNGFEKCTGLKYVDSMFRDNQTHFKGHIPNKFFYHGGVTRTVTYKGADLWDENHTGYKYDPTEYDLTTGEQIGIKDEDLQEITVTYFSPYATIVGMSYCFSNCNIDAYENQSITPENNPNYMPLTHIIDNGFVKKASYNTNEQTIIWDYDGVYKPSDYEGENLDDEHNESAETFGVQYLSDRSLTSPNLHFICAPDLLRYCANTNSVDIQGLFSECGYSSNGVFAQTSPQIESYGLKGRIVPYLLKPVSYLTNLSYVFNNCKLLSYYTTSANIAYVIPQSFFSYANRISNLEYAFRGTTYPRNVSLNVFSPLTQTLNINRIFQYCRFNGTNTNKVNISQIFTNKNISVLTRAFSVNNNDSADTEPDNQVDTLYVKFDNIFTTKKIAKNADRYVFDGYNVNYVEFGTKTLDTTEAYNNYRTTGQ